MPTTVVYADVIMPHEVIADAIFPEIIIIVVSVIILIVVSRILIRAFWKQNKNNRDKDEE
jgi:formate hydrogenlyase subunit 3/multisubunit Na+/H+ antiporter MnhD subunit